jgi:F0F1-type ATP synthase membrane subunit b/b'
MSTTAPQPSDAQPAEKHHPWGWIAACIVLLLVAGGLAIWALGLNGDLNDQKDKTAQAQQQAQAANQQVQDISDQVDDLSQTISAAGDDAQQAVDDANAKLSSLVTQIKDAIEKNSAASDSGG